MGHEPEGDVADGDVPSQRPIPEDSRSSPERTESGPSPARAAGRAATARPLDVRDVNPFVARGKELELFDAFLLRSAGDGPVVLHVHGPPGVGKSRLLSTYRSRAAAAGVPAVLLDGRQLAASPSAFLAAVRDQLDAAGLSVRPGKDLDSVRQDLAEIAAARKFVLLLDEYAELSHLDRWLREELFEHLGPGVLPVLAGRRPLAGPWMEEVAWRRRLHQIRLYDFTYEETEEYLRRFGVTDDRWVAEIFAITNGNPLALSLAIGVLDTLGDTASTIAPAEAVGLLVNRALRELPDRSLWSLVEAAAVVQWFTRDLLVDMVGEEIVRDAFEEMTQLSFVQSCSEPCQGGFVMHDLVRKAVLEQLQSTAADRYRRLRESAVRSYARRLHAASRAERAAYISGVWYLSDAPSLRAWLVPPGQDSIEVHVEMGAVPADVPELRACRQETLRAFLQATPEAAAAAAAEVEEMVRICPEAFILARGADGRILGYTNCMPVHAETLPSLMESPETGPYLRALGDAELQRYAVPPDAATTFYVRHTCVRLGYQALRGVLTRGLLRFIASADYVIVTTALDAAKQFVRQLGFVQDPRGTYQRAETPLVADTFVLDVRGAGFDRWIDALLRPDPMSVAAAATAEPISEQSVRDCLTFFHDDASLASSALMDEMVRLRPDLRPASVSERAAALRALILESLEGAAMRVVRRSGRTDADLRQVLTAYYIDRLGSHERVAERLGLPPRTYYRKLRRGIETLTTTLRTALQRP